MAKVQNINKLPGTMTAATTQTATAATAPALTSDQKLVIRALQVTLLKCKVNQMSHQEKLAGLIHEEQHILASLRDMIQAAMPEGYTITDDLELVPKPKEG